MAVPWDYAGVRGSFMTHEFETVSSLLAVKEYAPGKEVSDERKGDTVRLWTQQVLEEYDLEWSDVLAAVTNSGSDVEFAFYNMARSSTGSGYLFLLLPRKIPRAGCNLQYEEGYRASPQVRAGEGTIILILVFVDGERMIGNSL